MGGWLEGVTISNISVRNARVPIFIHLQNIPGQPNARMTAWVRSILISDVQAFGAIVTSSVSGIPAYRVEDVTLRNIRIRTDEAGSEDWRANVPPECEHGQLLKMASMYSRKNLNDIGRFLSRRWESHQQKPRYSVARIAVKCAANLDVR
jgi:hypothetical protein